MKVLTLVVMVLTLLGGVGYADTIDLKLTDWNLPDVKPGFIISLKDTDTDIPIQATVSSTLIEYKSKYAVLNLDVGGAPAINEPITGLTFKFGDLSQYGFDFPLRKYFDVRVGSYLGFLTNDYLDDDGKDSLWSYVDYGLYGTLIRYTF